MTEAAATGPPEFVAAYLASEQGLGRVRADVDPRQVALVLLATLAGIAFMPGLDADADVDVTLIDAAVDVIVDGIGPTSRAGDDGAPDAQAVTPARTPSTRRASRPTRST
jgi:hypothetical protein